MVESTWCIAHQCSLAYRALEASILHVLILAYGMRYRIGFPNPITSFSRGKHEPVL